MDAEELNSKQYKKRFFLDDLDRFERLGKQALEPLLEALQYRTPFIRCRAAEILGKLGAVRAIEPLIKTLESENDDEYITMWTIWALGEIGDERAIEPLKKALKDEYIEIKEAVEWALEKIRYKKK